MSSQCKASGRGRFLNIFSGLDPQEKRLRQALMNRIITLGKPLDEADIRCLPDFEEPCREGVLQRLVRKRVVVKNEDMVLFVYPVSALPTPHRVSLHDGRSFHAMCSIDAMGAAFTFGQDVDITSRCSQCQGPVRVAIRDGGIEDLQPSEAHVLHVDLRESDDWSGSC